MRHVTRMVGCLAFLVLLMGADFPKPLGLVSDYAHVMMPEPSSKLEAELRSYKASTEIEVAIVIVKSLDGDDVDDYTNRLANAWGIGEKKKDNGVVVLFSMEDRKVRIEVGYGLESVLTDAASEEIIESVVKPTMRKDPSGTIVATAHAVMQKLGKATYQQRKEERMRANAARLQQEQQDAEALKQFGTIAGFGIVAILFLLGLYFGIRAIWRAIKEWSRKRRLWKDVKRRIPMVRTDLEQACASFEQFHRMLVPILTAPSYASAMKIYPEHVRELKEACLTNLDLSLSSLGPDDASNLADAAEAAIQTIGARKAELQKLKDRYDRAQSEAPGMIQTARRIIEEQWAIMAATEQKGFRVDMKPRAVADAQMAEVMQAFSDRDFETAISKAVNAATTLTKAVAAWQGLLKDRTEKVEPFLDQMPARLVAFGRPRHEAQLVLATLRKEHSGSLFLNGEEALKRADAILAELPAKVQEAARLNSMEVQEFAKAAELRTAIEKSLKTLGHEIATPSDLLTKSCAARDAIPRLQEETSRLATVAQASVQYADVGERAREMYRSAVGFRLAAEAALTPTSVNWLDLQTQFTAAIDGFHNAINRAHADVEAAQRERERQREEEERARRQREDAAAAAAYVSSSSSSSDSFSVGGGGSFGGGGASGSW